MIINSKKLSGYWLRVNLHAQIDQAYISMPWAPLATTQPGLLLIMQALNIPTAAMQEMHQLPVRHIAFKARNHVPEITLYAAGNSKCTWPKTEKELHHIVLSSAVETNRQVAQLLSALPISLNSANENHPTPAYNKYIEHWKRILGPALYYHAGVFEGAGPFSGTDMEAAQQLAVKRLYPFLPKNGRIYDIGCGWGGPMAMLSRDLNAHVHGLSPCITQFNYITSLGFDVRLGNAECLLPPGYFNAALMLESFCQIKDKESFLKLLSNFTSTLVMRVNCREHRLPEAIFDNALPPISSTELRTILEKTGWKVRHWQDIREETLPTYTVWGQRLKSIPIQKDRDIEHLRALTLRAANNPQAWANNNPLIEVMAVR